MNKFNIAMAVFLFINLLCAFCNWLIDRKDIMIVCMLNGFAVSMLCLWINYREKHK